MKNKLILITSTFLIALALVSIVAAFGVSSPYWEGNPMNIARGDSRTVNLNLQNMIGDEDVTVKAELVEGEDVTSLSQEIFTVKAKTSSTMVPLTISMPKDVSPGEVKTVKVEFKTVSSDTGGIAMGTGMTILFDVVATEEVSDNNTMMIVTISIIIVLAIILWLLAKKKKK